MMISYQIGIHAYAYRSEFLENKIVLKEKINTNLDTYKKTRAKRNSSI